MDLVDEARLLEARGTSEAAREKYEIAAALEERCADAAVVDEPRSRGILRVSAVSIWLQAGALDHAESLARRYLSEPVSPGFHRELHELLGVIHQRRVETPSVEPPERAADLAAALRQIEEDQVRGTVRLWAIKPAA
jgi:hypothetical protein